ncbi:MAG: hypothetical protein ACEY29_03010 [Arsenophonus sp.]
MSHMKSFQQFVDKLEKEDKMKSIILLTIISISTNFIINSASASDYCNVNISPIQIDYGNIISDTLYSQSEKNNEGFVLTRIATLEIACSGKQKVHVNLNSSQADNKFFNAGHGAKVSIILDDIKTDGPKEEYFYFVKTVKENKLNARINKEWQPGYALENDVPFTKLTAQIKVKLLIPYSIINNGVELDLKAVLNLILLLNNPIEKSIYLKYLDNLWATPPLYR